MTARRSGTTRATCALMCTLVSACTPTPDEPGLAAFEGGFDPVRYDAGPLPALDEAQGTNGGLGRPLRFNVPPFYADKLLVGAVQDLEGWLEKETGLDVEILAPAAYTDVAGALSRGEVDVAELSPYQFALATLRAPSGITPVAATVAHGASTYGSYIVVREGSPVRDVVDLKGKQIAFVDPLSTSGYLLPAAFLRERGLDLDKDVRVTFAGSHPAALAALKRGEVDAAAVSSDLLIGEAGLAGPLVVVAKAGRMPYDAIVARADLPPAVLARVQAALLRLSIHSETGRSALRTFSSVDGFMPIPPGHYDRVIALARANTRSPGAAADAGTVAP